VNNPIDTWASVAEAVGTIGAVIVALFLQYFLVRRRRPRMSVSVSLEDRHENVSTIIETSEVWLRFKVHNKVGARLRSTPRCCCSASGDLSSGTAGSSSCRVAA
jgi:hypothetical protein